MILLAYKVSQFDYEYANFDPYEILGVPLVSSELIVFVVFFPERGRFTVHTYLSMLSCPFPDIILTRKFIIIFVGMVILSVGEFIDHLDMVSSLL